MRLRFVRMSTTPEKERRVVTAARAVDAAATDETLTPPIRTQSKPSPRDASRSLSLQPQCR